MRWKDGRDGGLARNSHHHVHVRSRQMLPDIFELAGGHAKGRPILRACCDNSAVVGYARGLQDQARCALVHLKQEAPNEQLYRPGPKLEGKFQCALYMTET
jgi:hypothetical protein